MNALCPEAGDLALLPPGPPLFRLPQAEPQPGPGPSSLYSCAARVGIAGPDSGQDRPWLGSPAAV